MPPAALPENLLSKLPLEQTVDVRKCSSPLHPKEGLFCLPTGFDSVLLRTPNGRQAVQTLDSCNLRESCYRISHVKHHFEIVFDAAGEKVALLKEIDVGRCSGQCVSGRSQCLLRPSSSGHLGAGSSKDTRAQALKKLLEVFGIEDPPQSPQRIKQPPQYMVDLYNTVAGDDGITKDPGILEGNTVRSFLDKTHSSQMHFLFVLSSVAKNEQVLTAELHLFKLRAKVAEGGVPRRQHFCQVSIYQVLNQENLDSPGGKKLLSARLLAVQGYGWEVFAITQAVRSWTEEESSNQGLLVTVQALGRAPLDDGAVQFASGRDHHESKKPMLVLFTDDGRRGAQLPTNAFLDLSHPNAALPEHLTGPKSNRTRTPRSADSQLPCQRLPLSVDFEEIGWSGWIISPRGYNAYHCKGSCPFPLGENMRPTNHATVQSIINALKLSQDVSGPCCVPDKLFSINLLYFDDDENVVLKQYDDMVAGSCGCH
ncbi:bone morphogenetic protein 2-like [Rhineura floridana]|uniref:bone morphogenetic protein 2-like n=1 Tax=Rhineura floridana TaxID=261503 RepID=UPI002AC82AEE|nr:bone morphogenetic protein 2-like [Rhineura floridana]